MRWSRAIKLPVRKGVTVGRRLIRRRPARTRSDGRVGQLATRPVGLAVVGAPFERSRGLLRADLEVTPTIVAGTAATVPDLGAPLSGAAGGPGRGVDVALASAHPAPATEVSPRAAALRALVTSPLPHRHPGKTHGPWRRGFTPPLPAPQGGRWYGSNAIFAAPASGVYRYLAAGPLQIAGSRNVVPPHVSSD